MKLTENSSDADFAAVLVGRTVTKASERRLELDDGTILDVVPNWGCGGCPSGGYEITALNGCDNVITSVRLADDAYPSQTYGGPDDAHTYTLFVFADAQQVTLLEVDGDDGNGYYGTGFTVTVSAPAEGRDTVSTDTPLPTHRVHADGESGTVTPGGS